MDEILHKYTAGELLKWLHNKTVDDYIVQCIEEKDGESYPISLLDIEKIKTDFIRSIRRYEVVKRGKRLFIFDNKTCQDILSWDFTDADYEYVQNTANMTCDSLNKGAMKFIGKKERCW